MLPIAADLNKNIGTYYFSEELLDQDIQNLENEVVGLVNDALIDKNGDVEEIVTSLKQGDDKIIMTLNYEDFKASSENLQIALSFDQAQDQLAAFLSNIETAAGPSSVANRLVSVRRLEKRNVLLPDGSILGQVDKVVMNKTQDQVIGVLVKDISTRPQYERIALPYPMGLRLKNTGLSNDLELAEEYVETVLELTAEGIPK